MFGSNQNDDTDFDNYIFEKDTDLPSYYFENAYSIKYGSDDYKNDDTNYKKYHNEKYSNGNVNKSFVIQKDEAYDLLDETYPEKNDEPKKIIKEIDTYVDSTEYEKLILETSLTNDLNVLPDGWIQTNHLSGMPIYLHRPSRVVSLSRPYYLGLGDAKSHLVPLSAISCLHYKKNLGSQEIIKNDPKLTRFGNLSVPNASVMTSQDCSKRSLSHKEFREYCQSLFQFKKRKCPSKRAKSLHAISENTSVIRKTAKEIPSFPNIKLMLSVPVKNEEHIISIKNSPERKLNLDDNNYVRILQEYINNVLKFECNAEFVFKIIKKDEKKYHTATVIIGGDSYGIGYGYSKRQAKFEAARATLEVFIPEIKNIYDQNHQELINLSVFNQLKVTDFCITKLSYKTTESPYAILIKCLQRNGRKIDIDFMKFGRFRYKCTMTVGEHTVSVNGYGKDDSKQKASQLILALLHPDIENWSTLLEMYGEEGIHNFRVKKKKKKKLYQLKKDFGTQPNYAILNKLKQGMLKVREQRKLNKLPQPLLATRCPYTTAEPSVSNTKFTDRIKFNPGQEQNSKAK